MKPTPPDWPRISSALYYRDAQAAIAWLGAAFGFEPRLIVEEGGKVLHSELVYGDGLVMVAEAGPNAAHPEYTWAVSPAEVSGGNTQSLAVFVDDADAHCARARAAGARILSEPATHDYGEGHWADRTYLAVDPEGHRWWFMQRLRSAA